MERTQWTVKRRWSISAPVKAILEAMFELQKSPPITVIKDVARKLDVTPRQIQIWFQNRRAKERKADKVDKADRVNTSSSSSASDATDDEALFERALEVPTLEVPTETERQNDTAQQQNSERSSVPCTADPPRAPDEAIFERAPDFPTSEVPTEMECQNDTAQQQSSVPPSVPGPTDAALAPPPASAEIPLDTSPPPPPPARLLTTPHMPQQPADPGLSFLSSSLTWPPQVSTSLGQLPGHLSLSAAAAQVACPTFSRSHTRGSHFSPAVPAPTPSMHPQVDTFSHRLQLQQQHQMLAHAQLQQTLAAYSLFQVPMAVQALQPLVDMIKPPLAELSSQRVSGTDAEAMADLRDLVNSSSFRPKAQKGTVEEEDEILDFLFEQLGNSMVACSG